MLKKGHHSTNTSRSTSLFQIRLKHLEHDVLVLKGNEHEAGSVLLSGNIVLSVNEPISVKRLTLRLYSTLRLKADLSSGSSAAAGSSRRLLNFTKKVYEHVWDPSEFNNYLDHVYDRDDQTGGRTSPSPSQSPSQQPPIQKNHSTTSLASLRSRSGLGLSRLGSSGSSSTNLMHMATSNHHAIGASNHVLVQGNYEIPFSAILPGSMPETIEGLPGCSCVYRLEANIERGKFHSTMVAKKHLRVVRTLTTDAVELSETIAVDNTWPKKVEYSLSCPTRALAIGSGTPISIMLVPLLKGLTLGDIKIQLIEFYSYMGNVPPMHSAERVIASKKIPKKDPSELEFDKWEFETFMRLPASLSKCCQDVDGEHVKVRHKLKFNIGLINPDGHVSELRASLPIQLFISPFVTVSSKPDAEFLEDDGIGSTSATNDGEEDVLFTSDSFEQLNNLEQATNINNNNNNNNNGTDNNTNNNNNNNSGLASNSSSHTSLTGLVAPPLYERHIYDRLWSDVSPVETPLTSGASTPRSRPGGADEYGQYSMQPLDSSALTENLRQLSLQRQAQEAEHNLTGNGRGATFNFNLDDEDEQSSDPTHRNPNSSDLYAHSRMPGLARNQSFLREHPMTPPVHLSRVNSDANILNSSELSRVPSYQQAMKSDRSDDFSPAYEGPSPSSLTTNLHQQSNSNSHINLQDVNRHLTQQPRSLGSRLGGGIGGKIASSRGSSQGSSPASSRNVSSSNLAGMFASAKKSATNLTTGGHPSAGSASASASSHSHTPAHSPTPAPVPQRNGHLNPTVASSSNSSLNNPGLSTSPLTQTQMRQPSPHDQSVSQLSRSASERSVKHPVRSTSSLSLHNLHFLNKKKDKK